MTTNYQDGHRQRLRERYLKDNGKSMPDYELLELLLMSFLPRRDVKPLAKDLINKFGNFSKVVNQSVESLMSVKGVGETVAINLTVVGASSQRNSWQKLSDNNNNVINNWFDLVDYCMNTMADNEIEEFRVFFLNGKGAVFAEELIATGTIDAVYIYTREVVKRVLAQGAKSAVLVHNHPSGDPQPSNEDINITTEIKEGLTSIGAILWDHLIVSKKGFFSFKDVGLLDKLKKN